MEIRQLYLSETHRHLLESLNSNPSEESYECKKKDCCRKYKKGKRCKKCPDD